MDLREIKCIYTNTEMHDKNLIEINNIAIILIFIV